MKSAPAGPRAPAAGAEPGQQPPAGAERTQERLPGRRLPRAAHPADGHQGALQPGPRGCRRRAERGPAPLRRRRPAQLQPPGRPGGRPARPRRHRVRPRRLQPRAPGRGRPAGHLRRRLPRQLRRRRDQDLGLESAADLPPVLADPALLTQVVVNLLGNAHKYTPAGGRIGVGARRRGDRVRIEVADTGPGVPPPDRERVFETLHPPRGPRQRTARLGSGAGHRPADRRTARRRHRRRRRTGPRRRLLGRPARVRRGQPAGRLRRRRHPRSRPTRGNPGRWCCCVRTDGRARRRGPARDRGPSAPPGRRPGHGPGARRAAPGSGLLGRRPRRRPGLLARWTRVLPHPAATGLATAWRALPPGPGGRIRLSSRRPALTPLRLALPPLGGDHATRARPDR